MNSGIKDKSEINFDPHLLNGLSINVGNLVTD